MAEVNQKDLVLSINEYSYVLDETKGHVSCLVGPTKMSLSQSDRLVRFNNKSKNFESCDFNSAKMIFTTAPENWYVILKNPTADGRHPQAGTSNVLPESVHIGRKVNIRGPVSFALYPGQMAKVVKGHALRSNQYLLARVYEADSASQSQGEMLDSEGNKIETKVSYVNGQILVIKGTEVSFYIPPTGIEIIPIDSDDSKGYVREAVTLERLEYCILKDEDGNKRYVHGPEVVFPKPTETFVISPKGGYIFKAIELSPISGIYIKVIAEYKDEKGVIHPVGEEMFITGKDTMIYYPRPEHAIINYDGKILHHAIAIPEGEGRYIMNRLSGKINTIKGPAMYLPDPRTEVVIKRKLTKTQCELWYPNNNAVLEYNLALSEKSVEKSTSKSFADYLNNTTAYAASCSTNTSLAYLEANANISRGTSYTKPRTVTLDSKLDGVVSIDVWTGYAVNVISKTGERKVVCGPQTVLLDYDQDLERLELSTGSPKTTDRTIKTVYLRHENNKVSDLITVETKDFVRATIKVSYCVDFDKEYMDKWFAVDNYVKYLTDRMRSLLKRAAKDYIIYDFYQNYSDIVRNVTLGLPTDDTSAICEGPHAGNRFFPENGMFIHDVEVLNIAVQSDVENMILNKQTDMIRQVLELADAQREAEIAEALSVAEKKKQELRTQELLNKMELQKKEAETKLAIQAEINRRQEAEDKARKQAEVDMQAMVDALAAANLAREDAKHKANMARLADENAAAEAHERAMADIEAAKQKAYAITVQNIMTSITPDLIASLELNGKMNFASSLAESMSPYAIGNNEGVVDTATRLMNGLGFNDVVEIMKRNLNQ